MSEPLSRRWFLRRSTAVATLPAVSLAGGAAALTTEDPEIIRLGAELEATEARFDEAMVRKEIAVEHCLKLWPELPPELLISKAGGLSPNENYSLRDDERDIWGNTVWPPDNENGKCRPPRRFYAAHAMRKARERYDGRTRTGRFIRRALPIAEKYEAAQEHARGQSGLFEARYTCERICWDVVAIGKRLNDIGSSTMKGVLIKARLCALWMRCRDECNCRHLSWFGDSLAIDVLHLIGA